MHKNFAFLSGRFSFLRFNVYKNLEQTKIHTSNFKNSKLSVRYSSKFQQNVCICKISLTSSEWCTHYLAFLFRDLLLNLSYKNENINFCSMKSICFQTNGFRVVETFQLPSSRKTLTLCNLLETFSGFQQVIFP